MVDFTRHRVNLPTPAQRSINQRISSSLRYNLRLRFLPEDRGYNDFGIKHPPLRLRECQDHRNFERQYQKWAPAAEYRNDDPSQQGGMESIGMTVRTVSADRAASGETSAYLQVSQILTSFDGTSLNCETSSREFRMRCTMVDFLLHPRFLTMVVLSGRALVRMRQLVLGKERLSMNEWELVVTSAMISPRHLLREDVHASRELSLVFPPAYQSWPLGSLSPGFGCTASMLTL